MTTWTLTCYDGRTYPLPTPLAWRLEYGVGDPCDSFWVKTLWTEGEEAILADLTRLQVTQGGETLFMGVVDECETCWGPEGCTATFSGRGMQALLLDNQAEAADFGLATWEAILARYVSPYGITLDRGVSLPAAAGFSVASGSSCWKVVYDFARYHGGVTPRFTRAGKLALHPWEDGAPLVLDGGAPVTRVVRRDQRYGVLSQVTVKDVSGWTRQTVVNETFRARGGQCSRVLLLPPEDGVPGPAVPGPVPAGPVGLPTADGGGDGGPALCCLAWGPGGPGRLGRRTLAGAGEQGKSGGGGL